MTQQIVNTGTVANDGNGDPLRTSMIKINENFTEVYGSLAAVIAITNGTFYSGTANNALYLDGVPVSSLLLVSSFTANLANYQTLAGLAANVVVLTANNTNFVGSVSAANVVSNGQLQANLTSLGLTGVVNSYNLTANLANYQLIAGLPGALLSLTSNSTLFVGSTAAANVVSNAQLQANLTALILGGLHNVNTAGVLNGQVLSFSSGSNTWIPISSSSASLAGLTDVNVSEGPSINNFSLLWNDPLGRWVAGLPSLSLLSDVVVTENSSIDGFVLTWKQANGAWIAVNAASTVDLSGYQTTTGLSANVATLASNNASYLGGVAAAGYVNTSGAYTLTGVHTYNANLVANATLVVNYGLSANGSLGSNGQVLMSNATVAYWATLAAGATAFTGLSDVTNTYASAANFAVVVNSAQTGLQFIYSPPPTIQVSTYQAAAPTASLLLMRYLTAEKFTLANNLVGSVAAANTAATANAVFNVNKNYANVGTITFCANSLVVFTTSSNVVCNVGDILDVTAPASPDATLAGILITLKGVKSA